MPKDKNNNTSNKNNGHKKTNFIQAAVSIGMSLYSNKERIGENIAKIYSNIYGEDKEFNLHEVKNQFAALGRLAKAYSKGEYREISPATFFKIATAIAYAGFGKDLIPDDIPGFGVVDDIAIASWALAGVFKEVEKFEEWESAHVSEELEVQAV
jgi:uncharacterized membrane protein YkvA (DUF1232 family)